MQLLGPHYQPRPRLLSQTVRPRWPRPSRPPYRPYRRPRLSPRRRQRRHHWPTPTSTPVATPTSTARPTPTATLTPTPVPTPSATPAVTLASVIQRVRPSVVRIDTNLSTGSGVIFEVSASDGSANVLTNYHVIEGASSITVVVNDSTTYTGVLLGIDALRDLAVVRICCNVNFQALPFGDVA